MTRSVIGGWAGWAIAHPNSGRLEGASKAAHPYYNLPTQISEATYLRPWWHFLLKLHFKDQICDFKETQPLKMILHLYEWNECPLCQLLLTLFRCVLTFRIFGDSWWSSSSSGTAFCLSWNNSFRKIKKDKIIANKINNFLFLVSIF